MEETVDVSDRLVSKGCQPPLGGSTKRVIGKIKPHD